MNETKKQNVKKNVGTGASSAFGAAVGVVLGNLAKSANASTPNPEEEISVIEPITPEDDNHQEDVVIQPEPVAPTPNPDPVGPTPNPDPVGPTPNPDPVGPTPEPEPELKVIGYMENVVADDGSIRDIAVLDVAGEQLYVVDVDQDGIADIIINDLNGDDELQDNEWEDVSQEGIAMQPLQEAYETDQLLAQNETDYNNDANVDDWLSA